VARLSTATACAWAKERVRRVRGAAVMLRDKRGGQRWCRTSRRRVAVVRAGRHGMAWPCRSCRARASRAWAGLGVVVHHLTIGSYEHAQGTKERQYGKVARARVVRERSKGACKVAGMARVWPCLPLARVLVTWFRWRGDQGT
jgi:hypothetical protein